MDRSLVKATLKTTKRDSTPKSSLNITPKSALNLTKSALNITPKNALNTSITPTNLKSSKHKGSRDHSFKKETLEMKLPNFQFETDDFADLNVKEDLTTTKKKIIKNETSKSSKQLKTIGRNNSLIELKNKTKTDKN